MGDKEDSADRGVDYARQKLRLEVAQLNREAIDRKRRWYRKPGTWALLVPTLVAVATVGTQLATGYYQTQGRLVQLERADLKDQQDDFETQQEALTARRISLAGDEATLESRQERLYSESAKLEVDRREFTAASAKLAAESAQLVAAQRDLTGQSEKLEVDRREFTGQSEKLEVDRGVFAAQSEKLTAEVAQLEVDRREFTAASAQLEEEARTAVVKAHLDTLASEESLTRFHPSSEAFNPDFRFRCGTLPPGPVAAP